MNEANIATAGTIIIAIAAIVGMVYGVSEALRRMRRVEQPATLPPQSPPMEEATPFQPDETLATEIFSEIVAWQVSDILSACHWYDNDREVR